MQIPITSMLLVGMMCGSLSAQTHHHEHNMKMDSSDVTMDMTPHHPHSSGTSILPESSPMRMAKYHSGDWMFMLHGSAFMRYTNQGGLRDGHKLDAPNWGMVMAEREIESNGVLRFPVNLRLVRRHLCIGRRQRICLMRRSLVIGRMRRILHSALRPSA